MQITTLIPAYKPRYLTELVTSLVNQTVKPAKVVISDDSPDSAFILALNSEPLKSMCAGLKIDFLLGPRNGGYNNFRHLFRYYSGLPDRTQLFHVLLDDDIIYPTFYAQHLAAHQTAVVQCVVSRRWTALESGQPIKDDLLVPDMVADHVHRMISVSVDAIFSSAILVGRNWLGEFSNATFRSAMALELLETTLGGINYAGLEDLLAFVKAGLYGPLGYINSHLGSFRLNDTQNSAQAMGRPLKLAFVAYVAMVIAGRNLGRLAIDECEQAIQRIGAFVLYYYDKQEDMHGVCGALQKLVNSDWSAEEEFLLEWGRFSGNPDGSVGLALGPVEPSVTVFMPVYNGGKFLAETLKSLQAQSFQKFEVLCLDDASTDGSLVLLQSMALTDHRFRIVRMSSNQGCAPKVINRALSNVRGTWCVYTSQDDLHSTDWLERMLVRAQMSGADAVIPDVVFYYENEPNRQSTLVGLQGDRTVELTGREAVQHSLDWAIAGNALWRSSLVKKEGFEDFSTNADEYSVRAFFLQCRKVVFCEGQFFYRQDNAEAITKKKSPRSFDIPYTFVRLAQFLLGNGFPRELAQREVIKALSAFTELNAWLANSKGDLSQEAVDDARTRADRFIQALSAPEVRVLIPNLDEGAS